MALFEISKMSHVLFLFIVRFKAETSTFLREAAGIKR